MDGPKNLTVLAGFPMATGKGRDGGQRGRRRNWTFLSVVGHWVMVQSPSSSYGSASIIGVIIVRILFMCISRSSYHFVTASTKKCLRVLTPKKQTKWHSNERANHFLRRFPGARPPVSFQAIQTRFVTTQCHVQSTGVCINSWKENALSKYNSFLTTIL